MILTSWTNSAGLRLQPLQAAVVGSLGVPLTESLLSAGRHEKVNMYYDGGSIIIVIRPLRVSKISEGFPRWPYNRAVSSIATADVTIMRYQGTLVCLNSIFCRYILSSSF